MIENILECCGCKAELDDILLHHYSEDSGGFCPDCGSGDIVEKTIAIHTGNGHMAKLIDLVLGSKCETQLDGETVCFVCKLGIRNA